MPIDLWSVIYTRNPAINKRAVCSHIARDEYCYRWWPLCQMGHITAFTPYDNALARLSHAWYSGVTGPPGIDWSASLTEDCNERRVVWRNCRCRRLHAEYRLLSNLDKCWDVRNYGVQFISEMLRSAVLVQPAILLTPWYNTSQIWCCNAGTTVEMMAIVGVTWLSVWLSVMSGRWPTFRPCSCVSQSTLEPRGQGNPPVCLLHIHKTIPTNYNPWFKRSTLLADSPLSWYDCILFVQAIYTTGTLINPCRNV